MGNKQRLGIIAMVGCPRHQYLYHAPNAWGSIRLIIRIIRTIVSCYLEVQYLDALHPDAAVILVLDYHKH